MSKQALEAFKAKLAEDENLRKEMTRVLSQDGTKDTASLQDMAAFAQSRGYDLSPEDVGATMALSDDQLESVAGGVISSYSSYAVKIDSTQTFAVDSFSLNFVKIAF